MDFPHYKFTVLYLGYSSSVTLSTYWICHSCTHSPHTNMHTLQNIFFVKHPIHSLLPVNRTLSMCRVDGSVSQGLELGDEHFRTDMVGRSDLLVLLQILAVLLYGSKFQNQGEEALRAMEGFLCTRQ